MKRTIWIVIGLISASFAGDLFCQRSTRIGVFFENEGRQTVLRGVEQDGVLYAPLEDFAEALKVKIFTNPQNNKCVLRLGSQSVKVTAMNPFVITDKAAYQMALPTLRFDGVLYVPLALFLEVVGTYFPAEVAFDGVTRSIRIRGSMYNITGVDVEEKRNGWLIRLITTKTFTDTDIVTSLNRNWLNVTLYSGKLDTVQMASDRRMGIVKKVAPFQFDNSAQLSFQLQGDVSEPTIHVEPREILISVRSPRTRETTYFDSPQVNRNRWLIDKIIIDPGHGGKHPGAVGKAGTKEKDITLDIAKRLKQLLVDKMGVEVLMTREDDTFVGLKDRTRFANTNNGKLFISIHANGNPNRNQHGFSTWVLGREKTQQALEVAEKENSVINLEANTEAYKEYQDAAHILNAIAQSAYVKESMDLAQMVNDALKEKTRLAQWGNGVYQAGFYVLIGAAMPSILVEVAFLSNTYEERLLRTRSFRQKLAEAIYESVKNFKLKNEKGIGSG